VRQSVDCQSAVRPAVRVWIVAFRYGGQATLRNVKVSLGGLGAERHGMGSSVEAGPGDADQGGLWRSG